MTAGQQVKVEEAKSSDGARKEDGKLDTVRLRVATRLLENIEDEVLR